MAKRASLSFDAVKASKANPPAAVERQAPAVAEPPEEKPGRGRPAKRPPDVKLYGMTLRIEGDLRRALRRRAEEETDERGKVVSVHDVILAAIEAHLGINTAGG